MNLNHLLFFRVLAQTENYTEAAKELMISQPSLSYAIKKLESDLEVPLFEKVGRNVQLTPYGKELQEMTEAMYQLVEQTTDSLKRKRAMELNNLAIGSVPTLSSNFLPGVIQKGRNLGLLAQNCQIFHGFTSDILEKLKLGIYDIGFCSSNDDPAITFIPVQRQPFVLLVNEQLYHQESQLKEKWFEMPLVTYRETVSIGVNVRKMLAHYTAEPHIVEVFDDENTIGGFVATNPSLAVVANTSLLKQFDLISIPLDEARFDHIVYLAYLTENQDLKKIKDFRQLVEDSLQPV